MARRLRAGALVAIAVGVGVAAGGALAQSGAAAAKLREQNFKAQGRAFKAAIDEVKKDQPDNAVIAASAEKLKLSSSQLPTWFPKGSGPETGVKMEAKAQVWSDPAGFAAAAERFKTEAAKFDEAARGADLAAIRLQARALGAACKNCHDKYRVPDKS